MDKRTVNELVAGGCGMLELGGRTYVVSAPTDADMATLAKELRRLALSRARSPLEALAEKFNALPAAMREAAIRAAVDREAVNVRKEPDAEECASQLYTTEGCRFWVWWLCRKHEPALTLKDFDCVTADSAVEVLLKLRDATDVSRLGNSTGRTCSAAG